MPSFEGLHDITMMDLPPKRKPYLIMAPEDRIGTTSIPVDSEKIVASKLNFTLYISSRDCITSSDTFSFDCITIFDTFSFLLGHILTLVPCSYRIGLQRPNDSELPSG